MATMTNRNDDKRAYTRIPSEATVETTLLTYPLDAADGEQGLSKNISVEGICIITPKAFANGDILSLKIDLPGWQRYKRNITAIVDDTEAAAPLTAVVEVVWCQPSSSRGYELGVKFRDIYSDDHEALKNYLDNLT